ncbi:MAG: GerAB/ArcD/ProY family transporter [Lachnospiraceae bacterium]
MFIENDRISLRQIKRMLMIEIFSASSLLLPSIIVRGQKGNGFVPLLVGSVFALAYVGFFVWIMKKMKGSYVELIRENLDKSGIFFTGIIYYIRFFINQVFLIILFGKLIQVSVLPGYALWFIIGPILFFTFYCSMNGLEGRARTLELLFPYIFIPLFIVLILALGEIDLSRFAMTRGEEGKNIVQTLLTTYAVFLSYRGIEFLLFLGPQVEQSESKTRVAKTAYMATLWIVILNIIIYIVTVGMFGIYYTRKTWWTALKIMQAVRLPGGFVERLDILFIVFWIFSMFCVFSAYFFYGWKMLETGIPSLEKNKILVMVVSLFAVFIFACFLQNMENIIVRFYQYLMWGDFLLAFFIPLFISQKRKIFG